MSAITVDHRNQHEHIQEPPGPEVHQLHHVDQEASDVQPGVQRIEAVSKTWNERSLIVSYVTLFLIANVTSFELQITTLLTPFATSAFKQHSLVSTVTVIQGIVSAVIKPPMGKIADVFGRVESFSITIFLYTIGYIQQAASNNVTTFASAQIFWAAGFNGLQILQQIFVADTTDLLNRALFSTLFDVPFLWTVWAGPEVGNAILENITWRWGYGIWAIILPVCFLPFAISLYTNQRKAKSRGHAVPSSFRGLTLPEILKELWFDLDFFGLLILTTAISLILLPLTLAPSANGEWRNESMIAMITVGVVTLVIFPFWETSTRFAPKAFFPPNLFKNTTIIAGCLIGFLYFLAFYMSVFPYFYSYLQIVQNKSLVASGNITRVFSFSSTVSSIVVSLVMKYTGHYKFYATFGACIYLSGFGVMYYYRREDASTATLIGTQIMVGIGGGFLNVPVQLGVQASANHQQVAAVTTVWLTILEVGGAVGGAISGAIWSTYVPRNLQRYLPPTVLQAERDAIFGDISISSDYKNYPLGSLERIAINRAYQETMRLLLIGALTAAAPIILLTLLMHNYKLKQMEQPVEGRVIGNSNNQSAQQGNQGGVHSGESDDDIINQ